VSPSIHDRRGSLRRQAISLKTVAARAPPVARGRPEKVATSSILSCHHTARLGRGWKQSYVRLLGASDPLIGSKMRSEARWRLVPCREDGAVLAGALACCMVSGSGSQRPSGNYSLHPRRSKARPSADGRCCELGLEPLWSPAPVGSRPLLSGSVFVAGQTAELEVRRSVAIGRGEALPTSMVAGRTIAAVGKPL